MINRYLLICFVSISLLGYAFFAAHADTQLLSTSVFKENEQSLMMVHPRFSDGSTNIIFYIDYGNNNLQYAAETISHGDLPFSQYYAPAPGIGKYVVVEYSNDGGTFGCSGISLNDCIQDPHFVNTFYFEVVDNSAVIPNAAVASSTRLATIATTTTALATTSDQVSTTSTQVPATEAPKNDYTAGQASTTIATTSPSSI